MNVGPELRAVVRFAQLNLHAESYPAPRNCDLILCRNVLIYFDQPTRSRITRRLIDHLQPGGYLFLGHAETLYTAGGNELKTVMPTVYARPSAHGGDAPGRKA
jgi:chemotaxis protein methyltransferase CheR